jgi:hypothetical protein
VDKTLELEKTLDSTEMQPAADWTEHGAISGMCFELN